VKVGQINNKLVDICIHACFVAWEKCSCNHRKDLPKTNLSHFIAFDFDSLPNMQSHHSVSLLLRLLAQEARDVCAVTSKARVCIDDIMMHQMSTANIKQSHKGALFCFDV